MYSGKQFVLKYIVGVKYINQEKVGGETNETASKNEGTNANQPGTVH